MPDSPLVHVVDDDEAMRSSLLFLLASAEMPARIYGSAGELLSALPLPEAGCIVTDVRMPGMSGLELLERLGVEGVELPVIVMTGHGDIPLAVEAMKAGAFDFIEKPFESEVLIAAIRAAIGRRRKAEEAAAMRRELRSRIEGLTGRERQVLDGLVAGHPNKTIAHDLGISPRTVEIYRANVMTKLQASSLSELIRMVLLVEDPPQL